MSLLRTRDSFTGREKIKIDVSYEDFISAPLTYIEKYLGDIVFKQKKIAEEIDYLKKYYKGIQEILEKIRVDGNSINNISVMNYAYEIVEFKKGFVVGKPIKYVNTEDETTDDMNYLNRYLKNAKKKSKDLNKYENLYTFGIAHTFIKPKSTAYNSETDAPFDYYVIDSQKTCIVYSNDIAETPLFSMYISNVKSKETDTLEEVYTIYYNSKSVIVKKLDSENKIKIVRDEKKEPVDNPITEYEKGQSRMGAFEPVLVALDNCNYVRSNQLDDIEGFINSFLVFLNQDPKYIFDNIDNIKIKRTIALKTNNPNTPADVKLLQSTLNHSDINEMYENIKRDIFDICGVPMATSNTGQGVSGEAQTYGGGWENAQAMATIETTYITQFEQIDLEKIIKICQNGTDSKLKNLDYNDIEIKYTINKSNNILTKTQAFKYWVDLGGSWERGLEITDLSDDSHTVGEESEKHKLESDKQKADLEIYKQEEIKKIESKYSNSTNENNTQDNEDNINN